MKNENFCSITLLRMKKKEKKTKKNRKGKLGVAPRTRRLPGLHPLYQTPTFYVAEGMSGQ